MKKIYTLMSVVALSYASTAQITGASKHNLNTQIELSTMTKPAKALAKTATAAAGDTASWSNFVDFLPEFSPSGSLSVYGYTGGGYVYGKNYDSLNRCASGVLNVNNTNLVIKKVILFAARKKGTGPAGSNITVRLWDMAPNKAYHYTTVSVLDAMGPNTILTTTTVPFALIDTSSILPTSPWTVVTFPTAITTNKNFAIDVDCTTLAPGDTVGFVSDKKNDAGNVDLTFHKQWNGGTSFTPWYCTDGGFFTDGALDNNVGFFAIMDVGTAVNEYFNGAKLSAIYPNPATTNATIEYSLEKDSKNVSVVVYDSKGAKVYNEVFGNQNQGTYKLNVNTTSFATGTYYYQLISNGFNITKELVITK